MQTERGTAGMSGMPAEDAPPVFPLQRLGDGLGMMGALGNPHQVGFDWQRQQQDLGPVFSSSASAHWTIRVAPGGGRSDVSDPFMLRMGVG